ncbi:MAG TPA: DUF664 domain-containing protein [Longimicrobiaceae bacterium]|nr:DUF664 domain-containing protein [Longimicrobiaceae bacterium]
MIGEIREILLRELGTLRREVEAYASDAEVWRTAPGISNAAGTLVLHLCGNLRHFVGMHLGGTSYVRDRDAEFARRDVPRAELLAEIGRAEAETGAALEALAETELERTYPQPLYDADHTTGWMLIHLVQHFTYHLGQVNYHRRILEGSGDAPPS